MRAQKGFTLAELLIALAILGVIATFTIPKVLQSTTSGQNTAIAKEAASMVAGAYSAYQLNNSVASGTTAGVLTQYMNFVKMDTANASNGVGTASGQSSLQACNTANIVCLQLHNGAYLQYSSTNAFNTTNTTSAIIFNVDPDGAGTAAGRVSFVQFINGRMTTGANVAAADYITTLGAITIQSPDPAYLANWN